MILISRPRVRVTAHAELREEQRLGISHDLRHEITGRLNTALRLGVRPGPQLDVEVLLGDGAKAVCVPSWSGGWVVVTITASEDLGGGATGEAQELCAKTHRSGDM